MIVTSTSSISGNVLRLVRRVPVARKRVAKAKNAKAKTNAYTTATDASDASDAYATATDASKYISLPKPVSASHMFDRQVADWQTSVDVGIKRIGKVIHAWGLRDLQATSRVNTVGFDIQLKPKSSLKLCMLYHEQMGRMMGKPAVVEYNTRMLGWQVRSHALQAMPCKPCKEMRAWN